MDGDEERCVVLPRERRPVRAARETCRRSRVRTGSSFPPAFSCRCEFQREFQRHVLLDQPVLADRAGIDAAMTRVDHNDRQPGADPRARRRFCGALLASRCGRSSAAAFSKASARRRHQVDDEPRRLGAHRIEDEGVDDLDRPGEVEHDAGLAGRDQAIAIVADEARALPPAPPARRNPRPADR